MLQLDFKLYNDFFFLFLLCGIIRIVGKVAVVVNDRDILILIGGNSGESINIIILIFIGFGMIGIGAVDDQK